MKPYYQDASVTIYHGDCLDVLPSVASLDLVVTDPPYIIGAVSAGSIASKSGTWGDMMNSSAWFAAWYTECSRALKNDGALWSFLNWRTLPVVMRAAMTAQIPITSVMVWDKEWIGPGGPQGLRPSYELVALMARPGFAVRNRGVPDVWRHKVGSYKASGHPAEKPVDLVQKIIGLNGGVGVVCDPFLGSGTTAIAAKALGWTCIGIETEERYCEIAARRCSQETLDLGAA
jgi:DNA modification methylase